MQSIRTFGSAHLTFEVYPQIGISQSELHRDKILELYRLGMNKQAIADQVGLTRRVVRYAIRKHLERVEEQ
ncbi:hypothetical protein JW823_06045 [bacterium]|nr:hypothetical protein [candidate division CSSED10-310 bacterium]